MPESPLKIFAVAVGAANTRAAYLSGSKVYSEVAAATWPDLAIGLSEVTKKISKLVGRSISPDKTVLTGSPATLESLPKDLKAEFIPESEATSAIEKALSKALGRPTAILDLGASAYSDHYLAEQVGRWLPFASNLTDLDNYLANRKLYPRSVPVSPREYAIDQAVAREAIIKLGEREGSDFLEIPAPMNLVLTGGLVSEIQGTPDLASLILDSCYFPAGVAVLVDHTASLTTLGAVQAAGGEVDLIPNLAAMGTFLHLGGTHKLTIDVGSQRLLLLTGELIVLPAGPETTVEISVMTGSSVKKFSLTGGLGGVYLDNRPRPLGLAPSSRQSSAKILAWRKALGDGQLFESEKER